MGTRLLRSTPAAVGVGPGTVADARLLGYDPHVTLHLPPSRLIPLRRTVTPPTGHEKAVQHVSLRTCQMDSIDPPDDKTRGDQKLLSHDSFLVAAKR